MNGGSYATAPNYGDTQVAQPPTYAESPLIELADTQHASELPANGSGKWKWNSWKDRWMYITANFFFISYYLIPLQGQQLHKSKWALSLGIRAVLLIQTSIYREILICWSFVLQIYYSKIETFELLFCKTRGLKLKDDSGPYYSFW